MNGARVDRDLVLRWPLRSARCGSTRSPCLCSSRPPIRPRTDSRWLRSDVAPINDLVRSALAASAMPASWFALLIAVPALAQDNDEAITNAVVKCSVRKDSIRQLAKIYPSIEAQREMVRSS